MQVQLPVKAVATSAPFLVLLWAHFANMWGIYFIATNGPKYTLEVLGFNMKSVLFSMQINVARKIFFVYFFVTY